MTGLADVRTALGLTQVEMAERYGTTQSGISRLERQGDMLVSTLRSYAEALGCRLVLTIERHEFEKYDVELAGGSDEGQTVGQEPPRMSQHHALLNEPGQAPTRVEMTDDQVREALEEAYPAPTSAELVAEYERPIREAMRPIRERVAALHETMFEEAILEGKVTLPRLDGSEPGIPGAQLTANDPEPPAGTLVTLFTTREPWCRTDDGWTRSDLDGADLETWVKVAGNYGPATIVRWGWDG